jgi:hypothetical protein
MAIPAVLLALGLFLVAIYADAPRMLREDWQTAVREGDSDSYYREFDRNLTPQARRFDLGAGLASVSASLIALLATTGSWSLPRIRVLRTPRSRWRVFLLSNLTWTYFMWAAMRLLVLRQQRDEFPPWADSIAIPMVGIEMSALVGLVVINLGLMVYLHNAKLPVPMWARPRTVEAWVLNVGVALGLVGCMWAVFDAIHLGDAFEPPAVVVFTYLLLVARAAASSAVHPQ